MVGTATAAHVLAGKTFTNTSGVGIAGAMANQGAWTNTPTASGKVTIPAGYHNGSGYVDTSGVYEAGKENITSSSYSLVHRNSNIGGELSTSYSYTKNGFFIGVGATSSSLSASVTGTSNYIKTTIGNQIVVFGFAKAGEKISLSTYAYGGQYDTNSHSYYTFN